MADRKNKTIRDMSISMGVIVVAVLGLSIFNGGLSFSPGGPSGGNEPTADVIGNFSTAGRISGFTVVVPKGVPASWHGSSFSVTPPPGTADAPPTVRGGWLTPSGAYVSLIESSGSPTAVLTAEVGEASGTTGSVTAGGQLWTISPGVRDQAAWTRSANGVTLLITGSATTADFDSLAQAVS